MILVRPKALPLDRPIGCCFSPPAVVSVGTLLDAQNVSRGNTAELDNAFGAVMKAAEQEWCDMTDMVDEEGLPLKAASGGLKGLFTNGCRWCHPCRAMGLAGLMTLVCVLVSWRSTLLSSRPCSPGRAGPEARHVPLCELVTIWSWHRQRRERGGELSLQSLEGPLAACRRSLLMILLDGGGSVLELAI